MPLTSAAHSDHLEIVKLLLEKGADIDAHGEKYGTALQAATLNRSVAMIRLLLDRGADPAAKDKHGSTPLMVASRTSNQEVRDLFVAHGHHPQSCHDQCLAPNTLTTAIASNVSISSNGMAASSGMLNSS